MKNQFIYTLLLVAPLFLGAFAITSTNSTYKCMIQMTNYTGEGAYIIVSIMDEKGEYMESLRVMGDDEEWYPDLNLWYDFYAAEKPEIDGITGATLSGGKRSIFSVEIDQSKINAGYTLRIETAVEDQKYVPDEVEIPMTTEGLAGKYDGKDYIRYVRILAE